MNCCVCKSEIAVPAMQNACGAFCESCNRERVERANANRSGKDGLKECLWCGETHRSTESVCLPCIRVRDRLPKIIAHSDHLLKYVLARYKWKAEEVAKPTTTPTTPPKRRGYWAGVWTAIMGGAK